MSLHQSSKSLARLVPHGREVTEAYGIEVQIEESLKGSHGLSRSLGDSCSGWAESPAKLVLQRVSSDEEPSFRQIEGNAARGMPRQVDHADFGPEWKGVTVLEVIVYSERVSHEPCEDGPRHRREQCVLKGIRRGCFALNDVRLLLVHGYRNLSSCYQLAEATRVVWMSVGNNHSPDLADR